MTAPMSSSAATEPQGLTTALLQLAEVARMTAETLGADIERAAAIFAATVKRRGTIYFCGNGGSAADAQHMAAEYVVRYMRDRKSYPAVALTTDTSLITATGNDFGFDHIFSRQIEALCKPGDLLVIHSTSGNSPNVLQAAHSAKENSITVMAFLARDGGKLASLVDHCIVVPTDRTDRAQEIHMCIEHLICDHIEQTLLVDKPLVSVPMAAQAPKTDGPKRLV